MDELKEAFNFMGKMRDECDEIESETHKLSEAKTLYTTIYKLAHKEKK